MDMAEGHRGLYSHWNLVEQYIPGFWTYCKDFHPSVDKKLASPDTGAIRIHVPSYMALQRYRDLSGPVSILSGYRSEVYNARVGGGARSQHFTNVAFDVSVVNKDIVQEERYARQAGFTGLGRYPSREFLHLDMGRPRYWWGTEMDRVEWERLTSDVSGVTIAL